MPKTKQKAELKLRGAGGARLSNRRRWHSHGLDRQQVAADEYLQDQMARIEAQNLLQEFRMWVDDAHLSTWDDAYDHNGWDPEPDPDALLVRLVGLAMGSTLASVAPGELRVPWLQRQPGRTVEREHLEARIEAPWHPSQPMEEQIAEYIGSAEAAAIISKVCAGSAGTAFSGHLLYFAPLWLRRPQSFTGGSLRELMDHLFRRFPVPDVLYKAPFNPDRKWLQWFICYAQGASLYELGKLSAGWRVPKAFQHHFAAAPGSLSLVRATVFAESERLGLCENVRRWLMQSRDFGRDLSTNWLGYDANHANLWRRTALWLQRHHSQLDDFDAWLLLTWCSRANREAPFSWSGRTVRASLRHAEAAVQNGHAGPTKWRRSGLDWANVAGWSVREICSGQALREEGSQMQHCVASYVYRYQSGQALIFSLRFDGRRVLTVEVDPKAGLVREARGRFNRSPTVEELTIVVQWLAVKRLHNWKSE